MDYDSNILNFFCQVGSLEIKGSDDSRCDGGEAGMTSSSPAQPLVCSPACPSPKRAAVRATVREQPLEQLSVREQPDPAHALAGAAGGPSPRLV